MSSLLLLLPVIWLGSAVRMTEWALGPHQVIRGFTELARLKLSPFGFASSCSIREINRMKPLSISCFEKEASRDGGFNVADGAVLEL